MSYLWLLDAEGKRVAYQIEEASYDLFALLPPVNAGGSPHPIDGGLAVRMVAFRDGNVVRWVAMAGFDAGLRVNGIPLSAVGMRVLSDRDEISLPGVGSAHYSAEVLARIVEFRGADRVVLCGRCRQEIVRGSPSVKCPQCSTAYHETSELNCFTYREHCAFCPQATALDAGFTWVPGEE